MSLNKATVGGIYIYIQLHVYINCIIKWYFENTRWFTVFIYPVDVVNTFKYTSIDSVSSLSPQLFFSLQAKPSTSKQWLHRPLLQLWTDSVFCSVHPRRFAAIPRRQWRGKKKRNVRSSDGSEAEKDSIDFMVGRFISSHPRVLTKQLRKFRFQGDCRSARLLEFTEL